MTILKSSHFHSTGFDSFEKHNFGSKVEGLKEIPDQWVPPFLVLPTEYYETWLNRGTPMAETADILPSKKLENAVQELTTLWKNIKADQQTQIDGLQDKKEVIVRSSAFLNGGLYSRGKFLSVECGLDIEEICDAIFEVWNHAFEKSNSNGAISALGIVIHANVDNFAKGHLSNERRVSRNHTNWTIEWESGLSDKEKDSQRFSTLQVEPADETQRIHASTKDDVRDKLKEVAAKCGNAEKRVHFEWIWDGTSVWIVQKDSQEVEQRPPPGDDWGHDYPDDFDPQFQILQNALKIEKEWKKTECLDVFDTCNLNCPDLYFIDGETLTAHISSSGVDDELQRDIEELMEAPVLIRTDVGVEEHEQVEPFSKRSDAIVKEDDVSSFLLDTYSEFIDRGYADSDFCFLIHHFMVSKSSALALASPGNPMVSIDSTWGIPDGLNYYPHDSFRVNIDREEIDFRDNKCKDRYLDVDPTGDFEERIAGRPWDWKTSVSDEELFSIARKARTISDQVEDPIVVMFFVDLGISNMSGKSIPWFYWQAIGDGDQNETTSPGLSWSSNTYYVREEDDLEELCQKKDEFLTASDVILKFNPTPQNVRNIPFVEDVAKFALAYDIPIHLEGSLLSHVYYILRRFGVKIQTHGTQRPTSHSRRFSKLVRDKIPIQIEAGGEETSTFEVPSEDIVDLLKAKAVEEALEFSKSDTREDEEEELADLFEIIRSHTEIRGSSIERIQKISEKKRQEKGGFTQGIVLVSTLDRDFSNAQSVKGNRKKRPNSPTPLVPDPRIREDLIPKELRSGELSKAIEAPLIPPTIRGIDEISEFKFPDLNIGIQIKYHDERLIIRITQNEVSTASEDQLDLSSFE